jgi:hypothetical protein
LLLICAVGVALPVLCAVNHSFHCGHCVCLPFVFLCSGVWCMYSISFIHPNVNSYFIFFRRGFVAFVSIFCANCTVQMFTCPCRLFLLMKITCNDCSGC